MLDERKEYEIYNSLLTDENEEAYSFLNYRTLSQKLGGLSRLLLIIARGNMFDEDKPDFEKAREKTKEWLIYLYKSKTLKDLCMNRKRLKKLSDEDMEKEYTRMRNEISSKQRRCSKGIFSDSAFDSNDYYQISYDRILANALEKGPLKTYYMVAKKDLFIENDVVGYYPKNNKSKPISPGEKDYLLKLTATFLQEVLPGNSSVLITDTDVITWASSQSKKTSSFRFKSKSTNNWLQLFENIQVTNGNNIIKVKFNDSWIKNYKLIDVTDDNAYNQWLESNESHDYTVVYKDTGIHNELICEIF